MTAPMLDYFKQGPHKWTRFAWARDANGESISINSPDVTCMCLGAALHYFHNIDIIRNDPTYNEAFHALRRRMFEMYNHSDIAYVNDCYLDYDTLLELLQEVQL